MPSGGCSPSPGETHGRRAARGARPRRARARRSAPTWSPTSRSPSTATRRSPGARGRSAPRPTPRCWSALRTPRRRGDDRRRDDARRALRARSRKRDARAMGSLDPLSDRPASTCPGTPPLFTDGERRGPDLHLLRAPSRRRPRRRSRCCATRGPVDLAGALRAPARASAASAALLCEGGPHLHAQLIDADLVDELFVTLAPKLAGGDGPGPRRPGCRARSAGSSSPGCSSDGRRALRAATRCSPGDGRRRRRQRAARRVARDRAALLGPLLAAAQHPQAEDRRRRAAPRARG